MVVVGSSGFQDVVCLLKDVGWRFGGACMCLGGMLKA